MSETSANSPEPRAEPQQARAGTGSLRKLVLLPVDPQQGRSTALDPAVTALLHFWEWLELVMVSPSQPAWDVARRLGCTAAVGPGAANDADRADVSRRARCWQRALARTGARGVLLVAEPPLLAALWQGITGAPLPDGSPRAGEIGLATREAGQRWRAGRVSSDPPPLRAEIEREGWADARSLLEDPPRHIGRLRLPCPAARDGRFSS